MIDHDAKPGKLDRCNVCGSTDLHEIIDLGHQPPCDAYLTKEQLSQPEVTYPLRLYQCQECTLAQLDYVVPGEVLYPSDYVYRAGISWPVVEAHKRMAAELVERFGKGLCVDIGCNDGVLLWQLKALGCAVIGVEPTGVGKYAEEAGIPVVRGYFLERTASVIDSRCGKANIITMTHVFAHMGELGEVMRGVKLLLAKNGALVIENHYLGDVLDRNQFDTIYHEHIRTYTLTSLVCLFAQYGMEVFDVQRVGRYGGNIRVFAGNAGARPITAAVGELIAEEKGRFSREIWGAWRNRVLDRRDSFMDRLYWASRDDKSVVGCSAPGRASTLLNFCGVTPDMMPYTGELQDSLKLGRYVPGCHIPVVDNRRIVDEKPDIVCLLAWHYADEIVKRLRSEGVTSVMLQPLPDVRMFG